MFAPRCDAQRAQGRARKGPDVGNVIKVRIDIQGGTPLLMHSDRLADPTNPLTKDFKRISSKRSKTDADYEEMAKMEYTAGLYMSHGGGIVLPARNVMRCLIEGARITKSGPKIERGLVFTAHEFPLVYDGPSDPEKLYGDQNFVSRMTVKVGTSKTVRCRPEFLQWAVSAEGILDGTVITLEELADIARNAGTLIGLGDYRKAGGYGRFSAKVVKTGEM
jgi:hypothetical protein